MQSLVKSTVFVSLVTSCTTVPTSAPKKGLAKPESVAEAPRSTKVVSDTPATAERIALGDVVAAPERFVGRVISTQGRAGVCPDLCDLIKYRCGTIPPSEGPCTGYVALAIGEASPTEVRCAQGTVQARNALLLDVRDPRFACRGHCGQWACPAVELGRKYEATVRLEIISRSGEPALYVLVPTDPEPLRPPTANASSGL